MGLIRSGEEIISATGIFGGTVSLFEKTLSRFGIKTVFVDASKTTNFLKAINDKTKLIFLETIGNPRMDVPDIEGIAEVAHSAGIPLVVDNTLMTPALFKPADFGADIVIHSTSKFINGHGTAIGGAIIDTGNYKWRNGSFADFKELAQTRGSMAFLEHLRNLIYRDLGGCPAPMNSFLMLQGLETLSVRMEKHCNNTKALAEFLSGHPKVNWVNSPGLKDNKFFEQSEKYFKGKAGGLLTLGLQGGKEKAFNFIDSLTLAKKATNLGDAKTLVLHPESTIFLEFSQEENESMGVTEDMIRVSVGIEDAGDIKNDFEQAIAKAFEE
jgi:O-acetylhomoserine (thiol)-lyase